MNEQHNHCSDMFSPDCPCCHPGVKEVFEILALLKRPAITDERLGEVAEQVIRCIDLQNDGEWDTKEEAIAILRQLLKEAGV